MRSNRNGRRRVGVGLVAALIGTAVAVTAPTSTAWACVVAGEFCIEPSPPTGLSAAWGAANGLDGEVLLTWDAAPPEDGVVGYELLTGNTGWQPAPINIPGSATSFLLTSAHGVGQDVKLVAVGNSGRSAPSAAVHFPWMPTGHGIKSSDSSVPGQITMTWVEGSSNEDPITSWRVYIGPSETLNQVAELAPGARSYTFTGLQHAQTYSIGIAARNGVGTGPISRAPASTAYPPPPPFRLESQVAPATGVGSGQVKLTWDGVSGTGLPTTRYIVQRSLDGSSWTSLPSTSLWSYLVSGLTNGTSYVFRVIAQSGAGSSAPSNGTRATPRWRPLAPTGVVAAVAPTTGVGSGQVKLSWNAANGNGSPVTRYVVQRSLDGVSWTSLPSTSSRTLLVSGLANGTSYRFRVMALNAVGYGTPSAAVAATPRWKPLAPTAVVAAVAPTTGVGSGQVKLTWNAANGNGSPVTRYVVQRSLDGVSWTSLPSTSLRSYLVSGLTNGTSYRFRVIAQNAVGYGTPSAVVSAVPRS